MKKKLLFKRILTVMLCLAVLGTAAVFGVNAYVKQSGGAMIVLPEEIDEGVQFDCILVLGCLVKEGGRPSDMLADRLRRGVELYKAGAAPKLLMSGDHGRVEYNEVGAMKQYAIDQGVPSQDVFMDHAGFSTYESIYRARSIFGAKSILIVTQEYHLPRALYIAKSFGLQAQGVAADYRSYAGQAGRDTREILARVKDFGTSLFRPEPTFLGTGIPISGNGDLTND